MTDALYLVIDSSTRHGAVGVWVDGALVRTIAWRSRHNHTSELMPAVDAALAGAGVTPGDLAGIVVAHGPGGFSALRAGLGVAKGLAFAIGVPVVGVSTLEATAYPYRGLEYPVCALIDAGREAVAWARFQQTNAGWKRRTPDRVTRPEALLKHGGRHTLFCGEAAPGYAERLRGAMGARAHVATEGAPLSRLAGLAELGAARLDAGDADPLAALRPHYLRAPAITQPRAPRRVR